MMANPPSNSRSSSNVAVNSFNKNKNEFPSSDGGNAVDELLDSLQFTELDKERSKHLVNSLRKFEHEGTGDPHLLLKNLYDADDLQHLQLNEKEESILDLLKGEVKDYIERSEQRFKAIEVDSDSDDDDDESNQTSCLGDDDDDDDFDINFGSMDDSLHNLKFMEVSEQHFRLIDNLDESFHDMSLQHLKKVDDDIDDSMVNEMSELRFRDIDDELDDDGTELVKQKQDIQSLLSASVDTQDCDDEEEKSSSDERVVTADSRSTSSETTTAEQRVKDTNTAADDSTEWIPDTLCDAVVSSAEDISCHLVHPPEDEDEDNINETSNNTSAKKKYDLPGPFAFKNISSNTAPIMMKHPHPLQQKFGFGFPPQQGFQIPFRPPPALAAQHQQNQVQQFANKANILTHSMSKSEHSRKLIDRFLKRTQRRHTIGRELQHSRMQVRKLIMDDLKFTTTNSITSMKMQNQGSIHFGGTSCFPHPSAMMPQNRGQHGKVQSPLQNSSNCSNTGVDNNDFGVGADDDDHHDDHDHDDANAAVVETAQLEEQLKKQHALVEHQQKLVQQRYETLMRLKQEHSSMMQHRKRQSPSQSLGRAAQQVVLQQQQRSVA